MDSDRRAWDGRVAAHRGRLRAALARRVSSSAIRSNSASETTPGPAAGDAGDPRRDLGGAGSSSQMISASPFASPRSGRIDPGSRQVRQLDRPLVHEPAARPGGRGPRPARAGRRDRLRQRAPRQYKDAIPAGRAPKGLIALRPLAADPMPRRADHVEILDLRRRLGPEILQEFLRPAEELQRFTSP